MSAARTRAPGGALRTGELALAVLLLVALGVFHVWSRTRVVTAGYALAELEREHRELVNAHDTLKIELAMLTSPAELEKAARTRLAKLGMAPPDRGSVLAAGPDRPLDGPGRAGVDGVGDRPRPAEPALPQGPQAASRRAAAGPAAEPGERLALRAPLRAGRPAAGEP